MRPYWIASIAGILVAPVSGAFDFKGIEVGAAASYEEISEKIGTRCERGILDGCTASVTLAEVAALMILKRAEDGVVESVTIAFPELGFAAVKNAAITKFGPPQHTENEQVQNRMGATFTNANYTWTDTRGNSVLLQRYGDRIDRSYLIYSTKRAVDRFNEEQKKKAADF